MTSLEQMQHGLQQAWHSLAEAWSAFRQRAAHALTHFTAGEGDGELVTATEDFLRNSSRWGVLAAELREDADSVLVSIEAPGMEAEDFEIEIIDHTLLVRGEKRVQQEQVTGHYHLLERAYGRFERTLHLPVEVDSGRTTANYRRGVLTVKLPKRSPSEPRRIQVAIG